MIPRILTEQDIRSAVGFGQEELQAVETSFVWASSGRAEIPPVLHLEVTEAPGDVDIKTAYVRGESRFAIKIASGFFGNGPGGFPPAAA